MSSYGLWLSTAGMQLSAHRQTVLANNMANVQTHGYKHDYALVAQRAIESRESADGMSYTHPLLDDLSGGLAVQPSYHNFAQGMIEETGRNYDLAIEGEGFFTVQAGDEVRYTRDGSLARNAEGALVLTAGNGQWQLLDDGGTPIVLDPQGPPPRFQPDGTVVQGGSAIAKLGLVAPETPQQLRKVGENLFEPKDTDMTPATGSVRAGALEGSNFDVMGGLAQTIATARAYQFNATVLQLQDNLTGQAISRVGAPA